VEKEEEIVSIDDGENDNSAQPIQFCNYIHCGEAVLYHEPQ